LNDLVHHRIRPGMRTKTTPGRAMKERNDRVFNSLSFMLFFKKSCHPARANAAGTGELVEEFSA
jgi:hypothetical protein